MIKFLMAQLTQTLRAKYRGIHPCTEKRFEWPTLVVCKRTHTGELLVSGAKL